MISGKAYERYLNRQLQRVQADYGTVEHALSVEKAKRRELQRMVAKANRILDELHDRVWSTGAPLYQPCDRSECIKGAQEIAAALTLKRRK